MITKIIVVIIISAIFLGYMYLLSKKRNISISKNGWIALVLSEVAFIIFGIFLMLYY
tara:strand:+ start:2123 stop:2293 length:171 start_codon:yes stop_codon:yes gene_type:complete